MGMILQLVTVFLMAQATPAESSVAPSSSNSRTVNVSLEVPILNNDTLAARDNSQGQAFEKALEQALPASLDPSTRSQRIKSAIRYIKSFRVTEEHRVGEVLKINYEIEIQESAFEADPLKKSEPLPTMTQAAGDEIGVEIVFLSAFNAAETVDQIEGQLKIPVTSFRLTRSAILLRVKAVKAPDQIQQELQAFVGSRAKVNLVSMNVPSSPPLVSSGAP